MKQAPSVTLRDELRTIAEALPDRPLTLLVAPGGAGKTTLARDWVEQRAESGQPMGWLALAADHADASLFLEDLLASLREVLSGEASDGTAPAFGESIERLLHLRAEVDPKQMIRRLTIELRRLTVPPLVCLDGYEHLPPEGASAAIVDGLLRLEPCPIRIVLTTRGSRPPATPLLLGSDRALEIDGDALNLRTAQVADVLVAAGVAPEPELVAGLLGRTRGWAMAIRLMARTLATMPEAERLSAVRELGGQRDLFDYIGSELLGGATPETLEILETAARIGPAHEGILLAAADPDRDPASGLRQALDAGLLIAEGATLSIHDLWREWLQSPLRQRERAANEETTALRIGRALEAEGEHERALRHYVDALPAREAEESAVRVLTEHGHDWTSAGRRSTVSAALAALPDARRRAEPNLTAIEGLLLSGSDPDRAIAHLEAACDAYREAGNRLAESTCLHELGVVAINENRGDVLQRIRRRMFSLSRNDSNASIRGFTLLGLGAVSLLARRYSAALRLLDAAQAYDHLPRERGGIGIIQSTILFYQGRWDDTRRRIDAILARPEQRRHGASYSALLVYQAMIDSDRGIDPSRERARLEEACEFFARCHYTDNRVRSELCLGHHLRRNGDLAMAREHFAIAESLARRIGLFEAVAAAGGAAARVRQLEGDREGARTAALSAISVLDQPRAWSLQRGTSHAWVPGIMLACCVLAEESEAERASAFLSAHWRRFHLPALAVCQHIVRVAQARVAQALDDSRAHDDAIREAWRAANRAKIEGFAPELDDGLLSEAARAGEALGLSGPALDLAIARYPTTRPPAVTITTFGGLTVALRGRAIADRAWRGVTSRRLLALLLVADGPVLSRDRLEASLWPDAPRRRAGGNLRTALLRLRDALEPRRRSDADTPLLLVDGDKIGLSPEARRGWDVRRWREALERARTATAESRLADAIEALEEAETLDVGEFLPELDDPWVVEQRSAIEWERSRTGRTLAAGWIEQGDTDCSIRWSRMVVERAPADESSWALLVRAHVEAGDIIEARRALAEARSQIERLEDRAPGAELEAVAASL